MARDKTKQEKATDKPSTTVKLGNDRMMKKILDPELGLKDLIEETFGVTLKPTKQATESGDKDNKTTTITNYLQISGKTSDDRKAVASVVKECVNRVSELEREALETVLKNPEKHAKRRVRLLATQEESEFAGFLTTTRNGLHNNTVGKARDSSARESEAMLATTKNLLGKSNARLMSGKPADAIKDILTKIREAFPDTTNIIEPYKSQISGAKEAIGQRIVKLHDMVSKFEVQQTEEHTLAKSAFSPAERDEYARKLTIAAATKNRNWKLDPAQLELVTHRALKLSYDATIDETFIGTIAEFAQKQAPEKPKVSTPAMFTDRHRQNALLNSKIIPYNETQIEQVQAMRTKGVVVAVGDAGTGKSMLCIAHAIEQWRENKRKIVIFRPMKELGGKETMGYLPGGETAKIAPYFRPIIKNMLKCVDRPEVEKMLGVKKSKGKEDTGSSEMAALLDVLAPQAALQILPLAYVRGDTIDDATIIVEEAQNLTVDEAKAIMTRVGKNAQIIFNGDKSQTDLPTHDHTGKLLDQKLLPCMPILLYQGQMKEYSSWMAVVTHPPANVVRSPLAAQAVGFFNAFDANQEDIVRAAYKLPTPAGNAPMSRAS